MHARTCSNVAGACGHQVLDKDINEVYLFHGTSPEFAEKVGEAWTPTPLSPLALLPSPLRRQDVASSFSRAAWTPLLLLPHTHSPRTWK